MPAQVPAALIIDAKVPNQSNPAVEGEVFSGYDERMQTVEVHGYSDGCLHVLRYANVPSDLAAKTIHDGLDILAGRIISHA